MMCMRIAVVSLALAFGTACGPVDSTEDATSARPITTHRQALVVSGTPEGVGVLRLLNHGGTDFHVLDREVKLDRRAAAGLIHRRDGADGVFGTADDVPFRSIEEVDAVKWVGDHALARLLEHAHAHAWVPTGGDLLGVYEGVPFTVVEAALAVQLVNAADPAVLDDDVALDARAVKAIVAARPIPTVEALAAVPQVGPDALKRIKSWQPIVY